MASIVWRRARVVRSLLAGGIAFSSFAVLGCDLIAGLEKRTLGGAAAADGGVVSTAGLANCEIKGAGAGQVRFGNLVPTGDHYDVCLKPPSKASFADVKPLFYEAGADCRIGLGYKDVTTILSVEPGQYEIKVVKAGSPSCDGEGVTSLGAALLNEGEPTALYLLGSGREAPALRRYLESRPNQPSQLKMKLLQAVQGLGALDFGIGSAIRLPSELKSFFFKNVAYGEVPPSDPSLPTALDAKGYVSQQTGAGRFGYAVAPTGTPTPTSILSAARKVEAGSSYTFFVTGLTDSPDFPLEMFACDETKGTKVLAACSDAPPLDFTVDNVNVQLSGPFAAGEAARRPYAIEQVGKLTSDLACITEIYQDADKDAVINAARSHFPYSYYAKTDDKTPVEDTTGLDGNTPTLPTAPACSEASAKDKMNTLVDCLRDKCSTKPGDETGVAIQDPGSCLSGQCLQEISSLVFGSAQEKSCWACTWTQYNGYEPMAGIRERCTTMIGPIGFRGQNGALILPRYPLKDGSFSVFPASAAWQTGMARAVVTLENNASVDVYCGTSAGTLEDCTIFPSVGPYAAGATDCKGASINQQKLHMKKIQELLVKRGSDASKAPTLVIGDFYSGPSYKDVIQAVNPENFAILSQGFSLGTPLNYEPTCTLCSDNPLIGAGTSSSASTWTRFTFLRNIAVTNVRSTQVFLKDAAVDAVIGGEQKKVPIGVYYPVRTVIRVAP